jgi:hypothetical protein
MTCVDMARGASLRGFGSSRLHRSRWRVGSGSFRHEVEGLLLPMFHAGQHLPLGRAIARQLVRGEHPWHVRQPLQELAEELLSGLLVALPLHEHVETLPILIHCAPERMAVAVTRHTFPKE